MSRHPYRSVAAVAALALLGGVLAACTAGGTPPAGLSCAWQYRTDKDTLNVAYPDTGATYWSMNYNLIAGDEIILDGTYPDTRYISVITYNLGGNVVDAVTDRDIAPNAGSQNPFADEAASPGGSWSLTVRNGAPLSGGDNLLSTGVVGTVIYRTYVADTAGDPTGGAGLPDVKVKRMDGSVVPLADCATQVADSAVVDLINTFGPPTNVPAENPPVFKRPANIGGLYTNPDNTYIGAVAAWAPGKVLQVSGRAPTTPDTQAGASPAAPAQLRYWSVCTNEYRKPYPVTDCLYDAQVPLDGNGDYRIIVSTAADRPAWATTGNGYAWVEWGSTGVDMLLIMRHMLPDAGFTESAFTVAPGAAASTTMGVYAPVVTDVTGFTPA